MTNEQAVKLILKEKPVSKAQQLAAMFACDDIIADDIEVWLDSKVSEHLMQFPDVARDLASDLIGNGATAEELRVRSVRRFRIYVSLRKIPRAIVRTLTRGETNGVQGDPATCQLPSDKHH